MTSTYLNAAAMLALAGAAALVTPGAEAGEVSGSLQMSGKPVAASHVLVHLHDNAEGVMQRSLKILVSEAAVKPDLLDGIGDMRAMHHGRDGRVHGVLFQIDPKSPGEVGAVRLEKRIDGDYDAGGSYGSDSKPAVSELRISADRVHLRLKQPRDASTPGLEFDLVIDAPIHREPAITAELQGAAMRASPAYLAVSRMFDAQAKGDMDTVVKLSSAAARATFYEPALAAGQREQLVAGMRQAGRGAKAVLAKTTRLVERGSFALILVDKDRFFSAVRENGEWRIGD